MCWRPSLLLVAVVFTILTACPSVTAECPGLYTELGGRCLRFLSNMAQTWPQANSTCTTINGTLAVVDDCSLLRQIALHIDLNADLTPEEGYWIGGSDEGNEGNFSWVDGSEVALQMPFWGSYNFQEQVYPEPNGGEYQNCLGLLASDRYYFHDVECDRQMAVLCETPYVIELTTLDSTMTTPIETADESSSSETSDKTTDGDISTSPETTTATAPCPPGYVRVGVACFMFFPNNLVSWSAAERLCTTNGGNLATLDHCDMLGDVAAYIDENGLQPSSLGYWIGATDVVAEGLFRWIADDSLVSLRMPFWGTSVAGPEPNGFDIENCVTLDANDRYFFHDVMCSNENAVLCRAPGQLRLEKPKKNDC